MATFYIPQDSYWNSGNYKMRLKVVQSYNSSTNKSTLTVTPQFSGTAGGTHPLVSGTVKYKIGSGAQQTLWDFSQTTPGGTYPYAAVFESSFGDMKLSATSLSPTTYPTSKAISNVAHDDAGNVTVTFYAANVQTTIGFSPTISGNQAKTFPGTPRTYTLTISEGTGSTVTVKRGNDTLSSGATITYGDTLTVTAAAQSGYALASFTINGTAKTSPATVTVTGAVSVAATADPQALASIYVSGAYEDYSTYIYTSGAFALHQPFIYTNGEWEQY